MKFFVLDAAEFERVFNEMAKRDFAWAYLPVPKIHFEGVTRLFLAYDSNKRESIPRN